MADTATRRAIEAVWRIESPRLIGGLVRMVRDLALAEDLAQESIVAAMERWPVTGIPDNPGAWLMRTARNRAIDHFRRRKMVQGKLGELGKTIAEDEAQAPAMEAAIDENVGDDVLRLIFIACHPILSEEARVALTLRLLGGLTTEEIARAFLVSESALAQRIVRAKQKLAQSCIAFEVPRGKAFNERLSSVLEVIYLIFNEGYAATRGDDWVRRDLCEDALRLGRVVAHLVPREAEVHGLVALMEIQASRLGARVSADGDPILLLDQDRTRWDRLLIGRGLAALAQAEALACPPGSYTLQAGIAACHARAPTADETDWWRIVGLYEDLGRLTSSPVVELNRAVALSMASGPAAGLELLDALADEPLLRAYHYLPSARGDMLMRLGRYPEARVEFERAADLTRNTRERDLLLARARSASTTEGAC